MIFQLRDHLKSTSATVFLRASFLFQYVGYSRKYGHHYKTKAKPEAQKIREKRFLAGFLEH